MEEKNSYESYVEEWQILRGGGVGMKAQERLH